MKIYVGNLSYSVAQEALEELFSKHGEVEEVYIPTDRDTGRPRGFAFVTMPNAKEGAAAIAATNGQDLDGRRMNVNEARPKTEGGGGGGGGGYGGGGGGGRGGRR
ncbi:MAG: RNA-binding protein [Planctomycetota bacterium]|nr:RNA-binding protein [Planctomycetota bacterium]